MRVSGTLTCALSLITCLGMIGAPYVISVFAPGFMQGGGERFDLAVGLLRWTFPYILLISLTAFYSGVLNTYGKFAISSFTPTWLNFTMIGAVWLSTWSHPPIFSLAYGVLVGGLLQLVFQLPHIKKLDLLILPRWGWQDPGVRKVLRLMGPAVLGGSVMQINLIVDTLFASFLPSGSVTWLYYSERMLEFPLGTFGIALSTVILPHLSEKYAQQDTERFCHSMDWALKWVMLIGLPATLGLVALALPIMLTLFQYGAFSSYDSVKASQSLMALGCGLTLFVATKVLISGFYAQQDTATPVKIALWAMLANVVLNAILIGPLKHAGLALASSLAAAVNCGGLLWYLLKTKRYQTRMSWGIFLMKVILASSMMLVMIMVTMPLEQKWLVASSSHRVLWLMSLIFSAMGVYVLSLWGMGIRSHHLLLHRTAE